MLLRPLDRLVRRAIAPLVVRLVAPPEPRARNERNGVAADVDRVALHVPRRPLRAVDLARDGAADVAEREDDPKGGGALVRARDVAPEPRPAHGHRDEPARTIYLVSGVAWMEERGKDEEEGRT